jgi:hypothetical protein
MFPANPKKLAGCLLTVLEILETKVVDPDWFNPDPNPAFLLNPDTDPDPTLKLQVFNFLFFKNCFNKISLF